MLARVISLAILLITAAVLAVGCGDKPLTKAQYEKEMTKAGKKYFKSMSSLGAEPSQKEIDHMVKGLDTFQSDLEAITPPEKIAKTHEKLIKAVGDLRDYVKKDLDFDKSSDPMEELMKLAESAPAKDLAKVTKEYEEKGYGSINEAMAGQGASSAKANQEQLEEDIEKEVEKSIDESMKDS